MTKNESRLKLFENLAGKAVLKQEVFGTIQQAFLDLREAISEYEQAFQKFLQQNPTSQPIPFESKFNGQFEIELKFGGDVLVFLMHSNIFEFPRNHEVMKTPYVKEDLSRSYHGVINIYNFLADSFKYNRINDIGYLIGRVFINKDKVYFVEGKRELAFLFNYFGSKKFDKQAIYELIEAAIRYTINFDLLTPPYDKVKEVTVNEMKNTLDTISLKTGKRLGFKFQADEADEIDG